MNEKFYVLPREKQDRMINAAIKIFAINGYEKAGTDAIIKEAGISKGLLFHYFGSKLNLYSFVCEYCTRYMVMELTDSVGDGEKNLFDRIRLVEEVKLRMLRIYPYLDRFLISLKGETGTESAAIASQWSAQVEETYKELIEERSDVTLLKKAARISDVRDLVGFCMDGYKLKAYGEGADPREIIVGFMPYLEVLKDALSVLQH